MYSPTTARARAVLASGSDWHLAARGGNSWQLTIEACEDPQLSSYLDMLEALRTFAGGSGLRPLVIDLRGTTRPGGPRLRACAELLALYESHRRRVVALVGRDLVLALRMHHLLREHAPTQGRCIHEPAEALRAVYSQPPPVPAPRGHRRRSSLQAPRV